MKLSALPDQDFLRKILSYDQHTGKLVWRERQPGLTMPSGAVVDHHSAISWNAKNARREAASKSGEGYFRIKIEKMNYKVHRVIWKMTYGHDPEIIDHINGDRSDNRLCNLRSCTVAQNSQNKLVLASGSSRFRGVSWNVSKRKWQAKIRANGRIIHLGRFHDEIAAARAYDAAAREFHREFAIVNFPSTDSGNVQ